VNLEQMNTLLDYENVLNEYSGKRYHFRIEVDQSISLLEVKSIEKEKIIIKNLTEEQMVVWFKRHFKVVLNGI